MKYTRLFSLLLAAVLSVSLLAGCASGSSSADSAAGSAGAASQSVPSSTAQANAGGLRPSFDENALLNTADTAAAFEPCLGWGPGVSGCSLKSVLAAASLMSWADEARMSDRTAATIEDAFDQWYNALDSLDKDSFAEAWPMIKEAAHDILTDPDSIKGRVEDAGLDPADLADLSEDDWNALRDVVDAKTPEV